MDIVILDYFFEDLVVKERVSMMCVVGIDGDDDVGFGFFDYLINL